MFTRISIMITAALTLSSICVAQDTPIYKDASAPVEDRVTDLMSRMTLEEKVAICHSRFTGGGIPRLGVGKFAMLDGRQGLRPVDDDRGTKTTALPSVLALSCTWDLEAAQDYGAILAEEMYAFKRHVLLAPMLNLIRSPLGGRNFENFGEDPYQVGIMGAAYIKGVQDEGIGACACLLVANDCEHRRHQTSSNMDDRTLRELHLLPYEMSVREGKVWSMMTGNNLLNGIYCAQNRDLLQGIMKDEIGFDGVMITDWRAAYETTPTALAGTDMTTGFCHYVFGEGNLLKAVQSGEVSEELLNDKARRVLRLYVRSGVLDPAVRREGELDSPAHRKAARKLAAEGMVLLKNENSILPLQADKVKKILLTGPAADIVARGGGSGSVPAAINVTPFQGLRAAMPGAEIIHYPYSAPINPKIHKRAQEWDEESTAPGRRRRAGAGSDGSTTGSLKEIAADVDLVIFAAAGMLASEGDDLPNMDLPGQQAKDIAEVVAANPNTVVVLSNNGAVSLDPWGDKVPAIVAAHYSGQATGHAIADVLTGNVNPGGKLTYSFAKQLEDYAVHAVGEWPAKLVMEKDPGPPGFTAEERKPTHAFTTVYKEGILAGYRWLDEKNIEPAYPFGHGLSYTTFDMSDLQVKPNGEGYTVSCTVKNTGKRDGSEVVQVYVAPKAEAALPRPPKELRGFAKVKLASGESKQVEVQLRPTALAYYDPATKKWKSEAGEYEIQVGNSSRNILLNETINNEKEKIHEHY